MPSKQKQTKPVWVAVNQHGEMAEETARRDERAVRAFVTKAMHFWPRGWTVEPATLTLDPPTKRRRT